jgi:hypothetical protein
METTIQRFSTVWDCLWNAEGICSISQNLLTKRRLMLYNYCDTCCTITAKHVVQLLQHMLYNYCNICCTITAKHVVQLLQHMLYNYCNIFCTITAKHVVQLLQYDILHMGWKQENKRQIFSCVLQTVRSGMYPTIRRSHTWNNCTFSPPKNVISMK